MGASPTRLSLQPEATGAIMEATKWLKPSDRGGRSQTLPRGGEQKRQSLLLGHKRSFGKQCRRYIRFKEQRSESALDELRQSVVARLEIGSHATVLYYMTLLARAYQQADRTDEGLRVLQEAQVSIDARGERWWEAEIQRLRGELLLSQSGANAGDAEACFERALQISRRQEAKSLELRATMSLARLWRRQGKGDEVRRLLGECYTWFTEGFDTADLKEAKVLLDELK